MLDPSSDTLAVTAAFNAFALGDTARGWTLYERRTNLPAEYPRLGLPPAWDRMAPPSGPLLVCAEQGVGDEFIFLSCLPDLLRQVSDVIVECDPRNVALFERSFSGVRCVPRTVTENQAGGMVWDYRAMAAQTGPAAHIMAASLPGLYSAAITRPALPQGYLAPGPTEATAWRRWLQSLGSGPKVGLCWRSGEADAIRSEFYFTLEEVLAAIGFDTAPYVSLMYVDAIDEIADVQRATGTAIHAPPELNQRNELDRVAALISGLDIVLTVDCAVCAISAACGVPTIRLECSYLTLANGRDGLFGNVYPCRDTDQPFDRSEVLRRGAEKFQQWVGVFSERASAPTAK
ncbi:MAG: hypothetical protein O3B74_11620 [Proteobacteria bacterium]|nr:hypothetical protein [Pseudomonadota bacterium]MDA1310252.1 hypothetical protein [Pseudomonadota bacterium]